MENIQEQEFDVTLLMGQTAESDNKKAKLKPTVSHVLGKNEAGQDVCLNAVVHKNVTLTEVRRDDKGNVTMVFETPTQKGYFKTWQSNYGVTGQQNAPKSIVAWYAELENLIAQYKHILSPFYERTILDSEFVKVLEANDIARPVSVRETIQADLYAFMTKLNKVYNEEWAFKMFGVVSETFIKLFNDLTQEDREVNLTVKFYANKDNVTLPVFRRQNTKNGVVSNMEIPFMAKTNSLEGAKLNYTKWELENMKMILSSDVPFDTTIGSQLLAPKQVGLTPPAISTDLPF